MKQPIFFKTFANVYLLSIFNTITKNELSHLMSILSGVNND